MSRTDRMARRGLSRLSAAGACLLVAISLGACSDDQQDLRVWMQEQRARMPVKVDPVSPPKSYEPYRYQGAELGDPFGQKRLTVVTSSKLAPDLSRRREALESFPLDSIRMIGRIKDGTRNLALLQVGSMIYQASVGNHAGQNYGKITSVTDDEVRLNELVQDAAGDWTERVTVLQLQEAGPQETKK